MDNNPGKGRAGFNGLGQNPERSSKNDLDRMLDSMLEKYAAVEPRTGLEERVLANLRAEQTLVTNPAWWRLGWITAAMAIVMVVVAVALKFSKPSQSLVKNPPSATMPSAQKPDTKKPESQLANRNENLAMPWHETVRRAATHPAVAAAYPKLDQFPSPQMPSKQEELLARYIALDPQRAALVAEARMEMLREDQEEERREATDDGGDAQPEDTKSR